MVSNDCYYYCVLRVLERKRGIVEFKKADPALSGSKERREPFRLVLAGYHQRRADRVLRRVRLLHLPALVVRHLGGNQGLVRRRNQADRRAELLLSDFRVQSRTRERKNTYRRLRP